MDETEDGWGDDVKEILGGVMKSLDRLMYEIRSYVQGCYTQCRTETELADYIRSLATDMEGAADEIG